MVKWYALWLLCCLIPVMGAEAGQSDQTTRGDAKGSATPTAIQGVWGVRYQVADVDRAVAFYTGRLGFKLDSPKSPAFAQVSLGGLNLLLSGPGSSGARPMPDGRRQEPGGWNRLVLQVNDLPARIEEMKRAGVRFRNAMETGPGGRQIQVEDPDGNPIELFEPAAAFRKEK